MGSTSTSDAGDRAAAGPGCYVGVAEAMRDRVTASAMMRPGNPDLIDIVGEMDTELTCARIAHRDMVEAASTLEPGTDALNRVFMDRTFGRPGRPPRG
jgi:hypothetical protein